MATRASLNKNSSAVKRILSEARELQKDDSTEYTAGPLEEDIFEWHCTIRGPTDTEFEGGLYHCRIILPTEYPFKAPSIMILTPNGRFELNKKICISFTSYHEELWQPAWGVRTAIVGLQGFFPLKGEAAIGVGAVEYPIAERKRLAALSRSWTCPDCGVPNIELLPDPPAKEASSSSPNSSEHPSAPDSPETRSPSDIARTPTAPLEAHLVVDSVTQPTAVLTAPGDALMTEMSSAIPIPQQLRQEVSTTAISGSAPPISSSSLSPTVATTSTVPARHFQPTDPTDQIDGIGRLRSRPPLWLDMSIVFFSFLIAYVAGKRVMNLWDFVTEHV